MTTASTTDTDRRVDLHAIALLGVLLLLFPLVVSDTPWSADIGARLYQAQHLLDTGRWTVDHPLPWADPDGRYFPLHLSSTTRHDYQYVVFPKHPAWVWMTAGMMKLGGFRAVVVIQTLATAAAAMGAARMVSRIRPSAAVVTLWFTGLLSPLFFDAYLGYGHSLAAALLIWAGVLVARFADPRQGRGRRDGLTLVGAMCLVGLACLIRTEASLAGLALGAGVFVAGLARRVRDRSIRDRWISDRWIAGLLAVGLATTAATGLDRLLGPDTTGTANPTAYDSWGGLVGRFEGIQQTWLSPGRAKVDLLIMIIAVTIIAVGLTIRRRDQLRLVLAALAGTVVVGAVRVAMDEPVLIFGLLMACPLLIVGLIKGVPAISHSAESVMCAVTFVLFSLAVAATQYRFGGVAEWGGRYFAAGLPFGAVVAIPGLIRTLSVFSPTERRRVMALAAAGAMLLNLAGLRGLNRSRNLTEALVDEIAESMAEVRLRDISDAADAGLSLTGADPSKPIVVTTIPPASRLSWEILDDGAWLLVDEEDLGAVAERLADHPVARFTLVTNWPDQELEAIAERYEVESWEVTDDAPGDVVIVKIAG